MTERDALPRHTTPTWEMELLISGATVFALLQLPGVLDELFYSYFPRFARPMAEMVLLPYLYGKTAVYALILTFILHLATRGYWVALVGLRSVYGDGVRWDALKAGPTYRRVLQARTPPLDTLVERADNRASLVFGYGTGFALVTLTPLVMLAFAALCTWLFQLVTRGAFAWESVWFAMLALSIAPLLLAFAIDRTIGRRLHPQGLPARVVALLFRIYLRLGMASSSSYPMLLFLSRTGPKRGGVALTLALFALIAITMVQMMAREGEIDVGSYGDLALGEPGAARTLRKEHYAEHREGSGLASTSPFIPAEIVQGDWLRLFVPFRPARDGLALETGCVTPAADVPPLESENDRARLDADAARARLLDCLARLYAPAIDGTPVHDVRFDAADDPASGLRGAVAMLPVTHLAPGRHELTVQRMRARTEDTDDPLPPPHRIVFWR